MKSTLHPLALAIAAAATTIAVTVPAAAEDQSWLCKNFPSTCASEDNPGGLPGHTSGSAGESMTRGLSDDSEAPAAAAPPPSPAPATDAAPAAPKDDKSPAP